MQSASMTPAVAGDPLAAGEPTRERLAADERRWNRQNGRDWRRHRLHSSLLYDCSPRQQDESVERLESLSRTQVERSQRYEPSLRVVRGLYPFALDDVQKLPTLLARC